MGKAERKKSEMIEIIAWEMMILSSWPLEKQCPGIFGFHALSRCGVHCKIQHRLRTTLLTARMPIAMYKGTMKAFVIVIRKSSRQIEILVKVNVAKVYILLD